MISVEQIARLAELYDRFNNALDPASEDCHQAKRELDELMSSLHTTRAPEVNYTEFRYHLVSLCREYLRKNRPA